MSTPAFTVRSFGSVFTARGDGVLVRDGEAIGHVTDVAGDAVAGLFTNTRESRMAENPYDRRRAHRAAEDSSSRHYGMSIGQRVPSMSQFAFQDIEAMVGSAYTRGEAEAWTRADERLADERRRAACDAWDEGHAAGEAAGRQRLIAQLDEMYTERANAAVARGKQIVDKFDLTGDRRNITKAELSERLAEACSLLAELITAHHNGFPGPDPF